MTDSKGKLDKIDIYETIERLKEDPDNEEAKEKIVLHYKNLVHSLARKYAKDKMNREDLAQVGMIGLINAAQRFDKDYGSSFEAYAIPTIEGEIKRYIRDKTWSVRVPRRIKELGPKIQKAIEELTMDLQRSPNKEEVANHLNVTEEELGEAMKMSSNYKSLSVDFKYNQLSDEKLYTLLDVLGVREKHYDLVEKKMLLESVFTTLSEREQKILKYVFYKRLTQSEVGDMLNISQMHVSRLQKEALLKLRRELERIYE